MMTARMKLLCLAVLAAGLLPWAGAVRSQALVEPPFFRDAVAAGTLPPVEQRMPEHPREVAFDGKRRKLGRQGGELTMLIGRSKDTRLLVVYGYARLVTYDEKYNLRPDIVESVKVEDGRRFIFRLRKGMRWSDGEPFTSEDFRYWWEDVANNKELSPTGPPITLKIDGEYPAVSFPDAYTVIYEWSKPNPYFLPALARAAPLFIYRPAHYLKQFHKKYKAKKKLTALERVRMRNWASQHNRMDEMYRLSNPDLPTLQPWRLVSKPPTTRFIAERNPYFHRIDSRGRQLPYIDRIVMPVVDAKLIPAKTGAGETDLQARGLSFSDVPFLKQNEKRSGYKVNLWRTAKGSHFAIYPNLNANDPVWRKLFRDVRFRRALSMAIDRAIINESLFFGLALEGNNTALPGSPLYDEKRMKKWTRFDIEAANRLLDEIGLSKRNDDGIRLLPDGRPMEIVVETAGESTEQTDILELITETWREIGIKIFTKPSQREVFRNRIFSGETLMSVWSGFENGVPTPAMDPSELAPTTQQSLQWPKWGQYYETSGKAGEPPDMPAAIRLMELNDAWRNARSDEERAAIWKEMLDIHADQQFTIGVISGVLQPVVRSNRLHNVPEKAIYNWDPGADFGIYMPDTFWLDEEGGS